MSTSQLVLNGALLAFVLLTNLGVKSVNGARMLLPVIHVLIAGWVFMRDLPTATEGDTRLELAGALVGIALGPAAGALMSVGRDGDGRLVTHAGAGYALPWIAVIGGRIAFAYPATGWASGAVGRISTSQQITGADAWTEGFVPMALTMMLTRLIVTGARIRVLTGRRAAVA